MPGRRPTHDAPGDAGNLEVLLDLVLELSLGGADASQYVGRLLELRKETVGDPELRAQVDRILAWVGSAVATEVRGLDDDITRLRAAVDGQHAPRRSDP
ncbi:MAG: hypothetical protein AB1942_00170 [Pseudomonadota bacterium]